jgi:hypothetical protein
MITRHREGLLRSETFQAFRIRIGNKKGTNSAGSFPSLIWRTRPDSNGRPVRANGTLLAEALNDSRDNTELDGKGKRIRT